MIVALLARAQGRRRLRAARSGLSGASACADILETRRRSRVLLTESGATRSDARCRRWRHVLCLDGGDGRRDRRSADRTEPAAARPRRPRLRHLHLGLDRHAQGRHGPPPPGGQPAALGATGRFGVGAGRPGALRHLALLRPLGLRHLRPARGRRLDPHRRPRRRCAIPSACCAALRRGADHVLGLGARRPCSSSCRSSPAWTRRPGPALRLVFLSGDWIPVTLPDRVRGRFPGARVIAPGRRHRGHGLVQRLPRRRGRPGLDEHPLRPADRRTPATTCSTRGSRPARSASPASSTSAATCLAAATPAAGADGRAVRPRSVRAARRAPASTAPATARATGRTATSSSSAGSTTRSRSAASASSWARSRPRCAAHPAVREAVVVAREDAAGRPAAGRLRRARRRAGAPAAAELRALPRASGCPSYMVPVGLRAARRAAADAQRQGRPQGAAARRSRGRAREPRRRAAARRELERAHRRRSGARCCGVDEVGRRRQLLRPRRPLAAARPGAARGCAERSAASCRWSTSSATRRSPRSPRYLARRAGGGGRAAGAAAPAAAARRERRRSPSSAWPAASRAPRDVDELWRNLRDGVESIRFFTDEELRAAGVDPAAARATRATSRPRGVLDGRRPVRRRASSASRRARPSSSTRSSALFLECAWEALEDAGYDAERVRRRGSASSPASSVSTYLLEPAAPTPSWSRAVGALPGLDRQRQGLPADPGLLQARPAGPERHRADRLLDLAGRRPPRLPEPARRRVRHGAGRRRLGRRRRSAPATSTRRAASSRPTATAAPSTPRRAGTVGGSGVGVVVLKRLADALADGDTHPRGDPRLGGQQRRRRARSATPRPSVDGQAEVIAAAQARGRASTRRRSATSRRTAPARRSAIRSRSRR